MNVEKLYQIKLNDDKTQQIIFGKRHGILNKYPIDFELSFNDCTNTSMLLDTDSKEEDGKCLGILLENDLSMKRQITNVKKSCFNVLYNVRNIKEYLSVENKLTLVQSLVLSKLDFCNALYI